MALQLGDHGLFHAVVRFRGHKGHIVGRRKVFVDHVAGDLHIVQLGSLDAVQAVGIGAQAGEMIGDQHFSIQGPKIIKRPGMTRNTDKME